MAEWARRIEGEILESDRPGETILFFRQPIGVVAGILPWNFPFFLIARKLGPALVCGNTIVIKPSEETPNNAALFVDPLKGLDIPDGVINFVYGSGRTTGDALCSHPDVGLISFTGSVATGSAIMKAASKNITKVNLELGGKAPAIVCRDADIAQAAKLVTASRTLNTGQVCNAAERVYVERSIADRFVSTLADAMKATRYGDPLGDKEIDMGPLINKAGLEKIADLVEQAKKQGAEVVTGGKVADLGAGNHYEPTVLVNCRQDMDIMRKEIFGPVLPVNVVENLDQAIELANDSEYGLTSSIYTNDLKTAMKACKELTFGETYINRENFEAMQGFHAGNRKSGIGGADGKHGLLEYTTTHICYIQDRRFLPPSVLVASGDSSGGFLQGDLILLGGLRNSARPAQRAGRKIVDWVRLERSSRKANPPSWPGRPYSASSSAPRPPEPIKSRSTRSATPRSNAF